PEPCLTAKEAIHALEADWVAALRFVPRFATVLRVPEVIWPAAAVVINAEQQRAVRPFQHVARRVIGRLWLDRLGFDSDRLPGLSSVGRTVQMTGRVAMGVAHVIGEQVPGEEQRAILEHGEIGLAAQQAELLRLRPGTAAVARAEEKILFEHFAPLARLLMKGGHQELAA